MEGVLPRGPPLAVCSETVTHRKSEPWSNELRVPSTTGSSEEAAVKCFTYLVKTEHGHGEHQLQIQNLVWVPRGPLTVYNS